MSWRIWRSTYSWSTTHTTSSTPSSDERNRYDETSYIYLSKWRTIWTGMLFRRKRRDQSLQSHLRYEWFRVGISDESGTRWKKETLRIILVLLYSIYPWSPSTRKTTVPTASKQKISSPLSVRYTKRLISLELLRSSWNSRRNLECALYHRSSSEMSVSEDSILSMQWIAKGGS